MSKRPMPYPTNSTSTPTSQLMVSQFAEFTRDRYWERADLDALDRLQSRIINSCEKLHPSEPYLLAQLYGYRDWIQLTRRQKTQYGKSVASVLVLNKLVPLTLYKTKLGSTKLYEINTNSIYYNH